MHLVWKREGERERERERDSQSIDISLLLVGAVDPLREQASLSLSQVRVGQSSGGDLERGRGRLGRGGQGKDTVSSIHSTHNLTCSYTTKGTVLGYTVAHLHTNQGFI